MLAQWSFIRAFTGSCHGSCCARLRRAQAQPETKWDVNFIAQAWPRAHRVGVYTEFSRPIGPWASPASLPILVCSILKGGIGVVSLLGFTERMNGVANLICFKEKVGLRLCLRRSGLGLGV